MVTPAIAQAAPRFTLVSAVHGVERYLAAFISSLEAQTFDLSQVQVIMVDDGSTDGSRAALEAWRERRPDLVTVLSKENGGQASARNLGLDHARGEWVSFPDPDDTLAADYLERVDAFLRRRPATEMVATRRVVVQESTGERSRHPLDGLFNEPDRLRDLDAEPDYFHGHAPSTFFLRDRLEAAHLRFDEQIRPNFEDGHFCCHYLLGLDATLVGFLTSAEYLYLRRADGSSTLDTSRSVTSRYTTVLEKGYLDVLRTGADLRGTPPGWLQSFVLYELSYYFSSAEGGTNAPGPPASATGPMVDLLRRIAALLSPELVRTYAVTRFDEVWREVLLHGFSTLPWHQSRALVDKLDSEQHLVRARYRYTGDRPEETWLVNGRQVTPPYAKTRAVTYFDHELLRERVVWLPTGATRLTLDGTPVELTLEPPAPPTRSLRLWQVHKALLPQDTEPSEAPPSRRDRAVLRLARAAAVRRLFTGAWVLMDRIEDADDSAEVLFCWMREHKRDVNAWFVVSGRSADHRRLRRAGYKRVISYGSLRYRLLMLNAVQLVSSHADLAIVRPPSVVSLAAPSWRYAFLNHGVIKDDLSRWLDPKDADVFVTSTPGEYASVAADGTGYSYTDRETVQCGMPRFDRLLESARSVGPEDRRLLVLAPTWRNWLVEATPGRKAPLALAAFLETEFARSWLALVRSPELHEVARRHDLDVALLLHPNLQPLQDDLDLPDHVTRLSFADGSVRDHFARARLLVTDFSSMAFNAAYLDRPVVYFQFDRERVLGGGHLGRAGYFDYDEHGYGPVADTLPEVLEAIGSVADAGPQPQEPYLSRIREAFPERDGRCTERTFAAIERSMRKVPRGRYTRDIVRRGD